MLKTTDYTFPLFLCLLVCLYMPDCKAQNELNPILILATDNNYGTYTTEILKAEGFNEYQVTSLMGENITTTFLKNFDIVILAEGEVSQSQVIVIADYVSSGGNLIAFRPDEKLNEIFGIINLKETLEEAYIKINNRTNIGNGLIPLTMQFHGLCDLYKLNGGELIASLFADTDTPAGYPSIIRNNYGSGHVAAFAYNLPKSIVYTRQGNPAWAGQERDGVDGPTATDLFYPAPGEKQWNNPDKIELPQADEQMRLLSHIIEEFSNFKKPLPRFWYFPDQYKCIFIFTIDGEDSPEGDIDNEILDIQAKGANATLYEIGTYISPSTVKRWCLAGNEVSIHYNNVPNYRKPTFSNMETVIDTMTANFYNAYGIKPKTVRNHWVVWCSKDSLGNVEFAEQAKLEEKYGLGFDCNYYQFGGNRVYPNWMGDVGHITGSGIPMKFSDLTGKVLNIYQSNTQLPDETWLKENIESKCKILIDRSLDDENYCYINANFHTWYWPETKLPGLRVLDYCNSRRVPVWTAEKVYEFLRMKDEASFSRLSWMNDRMSFTLNSSLTHSNGLTFMVPAMYTHKNIDVITIDDEKVDFKIQRVKGFNYAFVTVDGGTDYKIIVNYK